MSTILLVDDEVDLLDLLSYNLEKAGYSVLTARDGVEALKGAREGRPDLIVLDIMMPGMDGIEVCEKMRNDSQLRLTPILMLTARNESSDEVEGLDAGADDYLTKPVSIEVLLSHIRALLRRTRREEDSTANLHVHDLEISRSRYLVVRGGMEFRLPRKQFELLYFLAAHKGRVYSRQELLDQIWGSDVYVVDRTVDVHVRKIREQLGSEYIETIKGVGYKLKDE